MNFKRVSDSIRVKDSEEYQSSLITEAFNAMCKEQGFDGELEIAPSKVTKQQFNEAVEDFDEDVVPTNYIFAEDDDEDLQGKQFQANGVTFKLDWQDQEERHGTEYQIYAVLIV